MEQHSDWTAVVEAPLKEVVGKCFERKFGKSRPPKSASSEPWGVKEVLAKAFEAEAYENIPWLTKDAINSGKVKNGMLVRYYGMVQDVFDAEFFDSVVCFANQEKNQEIWAPMKYTESIPAVEEGFVLKGNEDDFSFLSERLPLYCIPIPGETAWARDRRCRGSAWPVASENGSSRPAIVKRKRVVADAVNSDSDKRNRNESEMNQMEVTAEGLNSNPPAQSDVLESSQNSTLQKPSPLEELEKAKPFNSDVEGDCACIVKVYDEAMESCFRLNERVEFVGVLEMDPAVAQCGEGCSSDIESKFLELEISARQPPASLVPRLHCITWSKCSRDLFGEDQRKSQEELSSVKENLVQSLTDNHLLGDRLAAEYLVMWMASGVFSRQGGDDALVGKLSLGLTQVPENSCLAESISEMLSSALPFVHKLPLTIDSLNQETFSPRKCHDANRLRSGRLQSANGTPLLIDETKLESGQLKDLGLRNLEALKTLSSKQVVSYDFEYYQTEWQVDTPVCVVSPSGTPLVNTVDCRVPIRPTRKSSEKKSLQESTRMEFQLYLNQIRAMDVLEFEIDDEVCTRIESDFVEMRQKNKSFEQHDLHLLLTLARLWCRSKGLKTLDLAAWTATKDLEAARRERM